ncbi:MAG: energy transducer TonB [bacterium]
MKISRRLKYALVASVVIHLFLLPILPGPGELEIPEPAEETLRLSLKSFNQPRPPDQPEEQAQSSPAEEEAEPEEEKVEQPEETPPAAEPPEEEITENPPPEVESEPGDEPEPVEEETAAEATEKEEEPAAERPLLKRGGPLAGGSSAPRATEKRQLRGFDTASRRYAVRRAAAPEEEAETGSFDFWEPEVEETTEDDIKIEFATGTPGEVAPNIPQPDVRSPSPGTAVRDPLTRPLPTMPDWLEEEGEKVRVTVSYDVNREGHLEDITITGSSGYRAVDSAVLEALREWRYEPGEPLDNQVAVFRFILSP